MRPGRHRKITDNGCPLHERYLHPRARQRVEQVHTACNRRRQREKCTRLHHDGETFAAVRVEAGDGTPSKLRQLYKPGHVPPPCTLDAGGRDISAWARPRPRGWRDRDDFTSSGVKEAGHCTHGTTACIIGAHCWSLESEPAEGETSQTLALRRRADYSQIQSSVRLRFCFQQLVTHRHRTPGCKVIRCHQLAL